MEDVHEPEGRPSDESSGALGPEDVSAVVDALSELLVQIDAGEVVATKAERAYIAGSLATLRSQGSG